MLKNKFREMLKPQVILLGLAGLTLLVFCVVPFLTLFQRIIFSGPERSFSLEPFFEVFASKGIRRAVVNTLALSAAVTVVCTLIGVPLAWLLSRTDLPAARRLRSVLCVPFAIPPFVGAIAWIWLANPTTGFLNGLFSGFLGEGFFNVYSFPGLIFVEASFLYAFVLLTALASLDRMDSSLEEAARLSGASPLRVFCDITLPILRPALVSGGLLVFLATAASFGVPALIGGPGRIYVVTTQIYTLQKMGSMSALLRAGALSALLMVFAVVLLWLSHFISRAGASKTVSGKTARPSLVELGRWKPFALGLIATFALVVIVLPLISILISSLSRVQGAGIGSFTLENWRRVLFEVDETWRAITNSLILSSGAATIAATLGLLIGYIQTKTRVRGRGFLDLAASLPYATPGTVVALALIITFTGSFLGVFPSLYDTMTLILIAYVVKYLSFAVKTASDGYSQIDDVLAEAARVSGASWVKTMSTIWLPLLKPAIVASWFLVFMPVMSELTMTTLLTGPGLETIGTLIFQLQEYADASGGSASVLAVIVIVAVVAINLAVKRVSDGKYGL